MKKVLIIYEYFYPAYKAGGPVQSLVNMITALESSTDYDFYVLTSAFDFGGQKLNTELEVNTWNSVQLPNSKKPLKVCYTDSPNLQKFVLNAKIQGIKPDIVYVNGLYTSWFNQVLWMNSSFQKTNIKLIISPRGMLQDGALAVKPLKKKLYLYVLNFLNKFRDVRWHATNESEKADIMKRISTKADIVIAHNVPKLPLEHISSHSTKKEFSLRLVYLSLITPKKQLHSALQVLMNCQRHISFDIYGPVKDEAFWQTCLDLIKNMPHNVTVTYKNDVQPHHVQQILSDYDAMFLPTLGENFGHAIYESLSVGTPVITSHFTPWNKLNEKKSGWNVDINTPESISQLIDELSDYDEKTWSLYRANAHNLAREYYLTSNFIKDYSTLFRQ